MSKSKAPKPRKLYLEAARAGDIEAVRNLLDAGVFINVHSPAKSTALMRSAGEGHEQIVRELLERGADINAHNERRETALTRAATQGQISIVKLLLSAGAIVDGHPDRRYAAVTSPLGEAVLNGHKEVALLLRDHGANPDFALGKVVGQGRIDLLDTLLGMGADINEGTDHGYTPLMRSTTMGALEMTQALLMRGGNPNAISQYSHTPLGEALRYGNEPAVVVMLFQHGARCQFLNEAVLLGDAGVVRHLLQEGADVNDYRPFYRFPSPGDTTLNLAKKKGNKEIVQLLLEHGAE